MEKFLGKYENTKNELFDEYLAYKKVWPFLKQVAKATTTYMELLEIGPEQYQSKTYVIFQSFVNLKFHMGETVESKSPMGQKLSNIYTLENGNLILKVTEPENDNLEDVYVHEMIDEDTLLLHMPAGEGLVCKRWFVKCKKK
ncbi:PREDICTED: fatty acid-binding protein homolog 3-like [Priapulus caudatus]|uniref:Fatty acid-binding protein homolog 3-like n=1 Tax=Priapulus caudatus TaxID=37621 RepID=A0ABM1F5I0_PRICU|nr:PREDICTED: fatty acid-binding protein homolog 3-like [Priapulus caudatus]